MVLRQLVTPKMGGGDVRILEIPKKKKNIYLFFVKMRLIFVNSPDANILEQSHHCLGTFPLCFMIHRNFGEILV